MAFRGMTIGPTPQVLNVPVGTKFTIQNVSEDHAAVLRVSIQADGVTPPPNSWGAVAWLKSATVSREDGERIWLRCEGADGCEIIYERAS